MAGFADIDDIVFIVMGSQQSRDRAESLTQSWMQWIKHGFIVAGKHIHSLCVIIRRVAFMQVQVLLFLCHGARSVAHVIRFDSLRVQ